MTVKILEQYDFFNIPLLRLVPHVGTTAPTSPAVGQLWTDTTVSTAVITKVYTGTTNGWQPLLIYPGTAAGTYAAGNDSRITGAEQTSNKNASNGYAGLTAGKLAYSQIPVGTTSSTVAAGDDSRITGAIQGSTKNVANGVAGLDTDARIAAAQLPSIITVAGSTGASAASRLVGGLATGTPASGTYAVGDVVVSHEGHLLVCVTAGTPGTWIRSLKMSDKNVANGIAGLESDARINIAQLPMIIPAGGFHDGTTTAARFIGGTGTSAPAGTSTYAQGDYAIGTDGSIWVCTVAGAPGTWVRQLRTTERNAANGVAGLDASSKLTYSQLPVAADGATTANTVVMASDTRLSNQRVPTDGSVTGGTAGAGVKIAATTITIANLAASLTDGTVGSKQVRAIGTGAQDAMAGNTRLDQLANPTAARDMNSQKITNLGTPTAANDAARLADVQAAAAGIDVKPSVRVRSSTNVTIATPGATIDGVTMANGDRVLLTGQSTASQNGPWIFNGSAAAMTRPPNETVTANSFWFVEEGTSADTSWMVTNNGAITLDTTSLTFAQFGAATVYTGTTNRITVSGLTIDIAATYVGQTSITTLGTVTTGSWEATDVAVLHGGTGASDAATARTNLAAARKGFVQSITSLVANTPQTFTHNLGTKSLVPYIRDTSDDSEVKLKVTFPNTNDVRVEALATPPAAMELVLSTAI